MPEIWGDAPTVVSGVAAAVVVDRSEGARTIRSEAAADGSGTGVGEGDARYNAAYNVAGAADGNTIHRQ